MAKKTFLYILIVILLAVSAFVLYRLLRPEARISPLTEVELVFPGGEAVFVEAGGLRDVWDLFKGSDYYKEKGYTPLLTVPVLEEFSRKFEEIEGEIGRDVSFDVLMYLLGREVALGFYMDGSGEEIGEGLDYLVVSRVYPEVIFVERLATFFAGDRYITESNYRGLKLKEIVIEEGREGTQDFGKIVYTINGDLLILTGSKDLFHAAADRHLDGGRGGLADDRRFLAARKKVNSKVNGGRKKPYLFGFVDTERLGEIPIVSEALAKIEGYLSCDLLLFNARFGDANGGGFNPGQVKIELETRSCENRGFNKSKAGFLTGGSIEAAMADDGIILANVHDLSLMPWSALEGFSDSKGVLLSAVSGLFFDGFTAALVQGNDNCPGLAAWGKSPPGAMKIIAAMAEKNGWAIIENETGDLKLYSVVETVAFGPELMVFTFNDNILFMGDRGEIVTSLVKKVKVKKTFFSRLRLKRREGGFSLMARPDPLWESMQACPSTFEVFSTRLLPPQEDNISVLKRCEFIRGLYPVKEVAIDLHPTESGIKAKISIDINTDMNAEGIR